jgi:hypothetical protein
MRPAFQAHRGPEENQGTGAMSGGCRRHGGGVLTRGLGVSLHGRPSAGRKARSPAHSTRSSCSSGLSAFPRLRTRLVQGCFRRVHDRKALLLLRRDDSPDASSCRQNDPSMIFFGLLPGVCCRGLESELHQHPTALRANGLPLLRRYSGGAAGTFQAGNRGHKDMIFQRLSSLAIYRGTRLPAP